MPVDRSAVERFLFQEARLMDEHRYDEWLALWDPDATYWIPCNADDIDPTRNVSVVYDRRGQLRNRIQRLKETLWLREQAPRLKRLVSNILVESESPSELAALVWVRHEELLPFLDPGRLDRLARRDS